jgi:hypothetical protein
MQLVAVHLYLLSPQLSLLMASMSPALNAMPPTLPAEGEGSRSPVSWNTLSTHREPRRGSGDVEADDDEEEDGCWPVVEAS